MCIPRIRYNNERHLSSTCTSSTTNCSKPLSLCAEEEKCVHDVQKANEYAIGDNKDDISRFITKCNLPCLHQKECEVNVEELESEEYESLGEESSLRNNVREVTKNKENNEELRESNENKIESQNLLECDRLNESENLLDKRKIDLREQCVEQTPLKEELEEIIVSMEQPNCHYNEGLNDCISADIDATSVVPEEIMNYYINNQKEQSTLCQENLSELHNDKKEMSKSERYARFRNNCELKESILKTAKKAEPINWRQHPSHIIVLSLLQYRGIFLPRHRALVEYHMAELFLHYLDICRRGAYFVVYAKNKWPREKFFRLRMLPRDWSSSSEVAVPQLVCTLHDTAIDVSNSTPLTMLVGLTQGVGEMVYSDDKNDINSKEEEQEEHTYHKKSINNKNDTVSESFGSSTASSKSSTTKFTKLKAVTSYQSRHRVRPFLPFIIDKEFILGCRDGRGHRTRL